MQVEQHGLKNRVDKPLVIILALLLPQLGWALGGEPSGDPPRTPVGLAAEGGLEPFLGESKFQAQTLFQG